MEKPKVFITRPLPIEAINMLERTAETSVWIEETPPPRDILTREMIRADGLLCMPTDKIDADMMDAALNLRVISNYAVRVDNIDVVAATARGIAVGNTPKLLTETTADPAFVAVENVIAGLEGKPLPHGVNVILIPGATA